MFRTEQYTLPSWARALAIAVGVIAIVLGIVFLIYPQIALGLFVFLVAIFAIVYGIERIAAGASGQATRVAVQGLTSPAPPASGSSPPTR